MFRTPAKQAVNLFVSVEAVVPVITALFRWDAFELTASQAGRAEAGQMQDQPWAGRLEACTRQAEQLDELLEILALDRTDTLPETEFELGDDVDCDPQQLEQAQRSIHAWRDRRARLKREYNQIQFLIEEIHLLQPLEITIRGIEHLDYLYVTVGTIEQRYLNRLRMPLAHIPFVVIPIFQTEAHVLLVAATTPEHAPILNQVLRGVFMEPLEVPEDISGTPETILAELETRRQQIEHQQDSLNQQRDQLARQWRDTLVTLRQQAGAKAKLARQINGFEQHGPQFLITGRIEAGAFEQLVQKVADITQEPHAVLLLEFQS